MTNIKFEDMDAVKSFVSGVKLRPNFERMSPQENTNFRRSFPFSAPWTTPIGIPAAKATENKKADRILAEQFFQSINSPIATSGKRIYLANESDMTLFKLGMYL